ncbi:hypothetical protein L1887_56656 [Cichorium endivia]|nr:hypothetical protein L1887_56656 [Cichorium endivia]
MKLVSAAILRENTPDSTPRSASALPFTLWQGQPVRMDQSSSPLDTCIVLELTKSPAVASSVVQIGRSERPAATQSQLAGLWPGASSKVAKEKEEMSGHSVIPKSWAATLVLLTAPRSSPPKLTKSLKVEPNLACRFCNETSQVSAPKEAKGYVTEIAVCGKKGRGLDVGLGLGIGQGRRTSTRNWDGVGGNWKRGKPARFCLLSKMGWR